MVRPTDGIEVYGQDGFGWYTYKSDIESSPRTFQAFEKTPSRNPIFVHLEGCTKRKLQARGFLPTGD